jgi:phosphoglycolate phosphatase
MLIQPLARSRALQDKPMLPRALLFDLDGTLVQTREASWKLFAKTNAAFGLGISTQEEFFQLLEDNMFHALRKRCRDERKADEAARHFLSLLESEYNPEFVPGMCDVVKAFAGNCSLAVISSNAVATIRRILTHANVANCFSHVFGGDVEQDKRASVRRFLADRSYLVNRDCSPAYREGEQPSVPTGEEIVLITDTVGDVKHARECGIRAVGVAWGMHSEKQLLQAGAEFVALWPQELVAHLLPGGFAAISCCVAKPHREQVCGCNETPVNSACGCGGDGLVQASGIRRDRSIAAAVNFAARIGDDREDTVRKGNLPAPTKMDATLIHSLARLRNHIRSSTRVTT